MKWHDKRANTVDFVETAETGKTDKQGGRRDKAESYPRLQFGYTKH